MFWLIKNLNDIYIGNFLMNENFAGNTSGVAIKYKLIGLEQIRSRKEREFKKALQRRIELIGGMLKLFLRRIFLRIFRSKLKL